GAGGGYFLNNPLILKKAGSHLFSTSVTEHAWRMLGDASDWRLCHNVIASEYNERSNLVRS
ncbi:MAG: hypothetical protein ABFD57_01995, partial [Smithella sp.]